MRRRSALLDLLAEHGVRATFCVVGAEVRAAGGAEVLRRTVAEGHRLAAHGMTYADQGAWRPGRVRADLRATVAVIRERAGRPDGARAVVPGAQRQLGVARRPVAVELGMQPLGVTGTIDDWRTQHVPTLVRQPAGAIRPGGVVLAHDGGGDRWGTVEALRRVLPQWLADGWHFTRPAHPDASATDLGSP